MSIFDKLLTEALEASSPLTHKEFSDFIAAIVTSTSREKIPAAFEKALSLSQEQLITVIKRVQFTGSSQAIELAVAANPEYATMFSEIARRVMSEKDVLSTTGNWADSMIPEKIHHERGGKCTQCSTGTYQQFDPNKIADPDGHGDSVDYYENYDDVESMLFCDNCGYDEPMTGNELYPCSSCDRFVHPHNYNSDDESCDHCADGGVEEYNPEGDYFSQGEDEGGH
jgi:hypothetical protein